jgi:hypothetical protein
MLPSLIGMGHSFCALHVERLHEGDWTSIESRALLNGAISILRGRDDDPQS